MGKITEDMIWEQLENNSKYADFINFSSRPILNEEDAYVSLMGLPSQFSHELLSRYQRKGYLERNDIAEAFRMNDRETDA